MKNNIEHMAFHLRYYMPYHRLNLKLEMFFPTLLPGGRKVTIREKMLIVEICYGIFLLMFGKIYKVVMNKIKL